MYYKAKRQRSNKGNNMKWKEERKRVTEVFGLIEYYFFGKAIFAINFRVRQNYGTNYRHTI